MRTPLPPDSGRIRLTISVSQEVHDTFQMLAQAGGMSLSRAMGDWLEDTREGAAYMAETMAKARAAPREAAMELHAYAMGLTDLTGDLLAEIREKSRAPAGRGDAARPRPAAGRGPAPTPPSNTGVTTAKNKTRKGGNDAQNRH